MTENPFKKLLDLGFTRLVPIIPPNAPISERSNLFKRIEKGDDARGKVPGIRWPDGSWSGYDFVASEEIHADRWHEMGANVGIKTGQGLILIDADTKTVEHAKIIKELIETKFGPLPVRIGDFPKAGYLVRTDADFSYARIEFGERNDKGLLQDRVELLAEGKQFVAIGTHPKTMKPYRWPKGVPNLNDVPFIHSHDLLNFLEELRPLLPAASKVSQEGSGAEVDQDTLRGNIEIIAKAVKATPNTSNHFPTRESYRDFGYAIKAAAGPEHEAEALDLFMDWCGRWTDGSNEPEIVQADWNRMKPPFRRGASFIYEQATKYGMDFDSEEAVADKWFEKTEAPLFPEVLPKAFKEPIKKFTFLDFNTAANSALENGTDPLVKGLLDQGAMTVLYGPSNVGKTFVAMDIAFHIAAGRNYAGMRTTQGAVIYVAAEGGRGAKRRLLAMRERYKHDGRVELLLLASPVDLRRPDADLKPLISAIQGLGVPVMMIVIDTLSRAMAGGDENSSVDMGFIVNHFDVLRTVTAAHLMVVHHSGKNAAAGARGHSLLRAATDTEIEVSDGLVSVTKQRDLERSWQSGFALDIMTLGVDGDGDPITSCTIRLTDAPAGSVVTVGEMTPKEGQLVGAIRTLQALNLDGEEGVSAAELVNYFSASKDKLSLAAVRALLKNLVNKGIGTKCLRGRWKVEVVESGGEVVESIFD